MPHNTLIQLHRTQYKPCMLCILEQTRAFHSHCGYTFFQRNKLQVFKILHRVRLTERSDSHRVLPHTMRPDARLGLIVTAAAIGSLLLGFKVQDEVRAARAADIERRVAEGVAAELAKRKPAAG